MHYNLLFNGCSYTFGMELNGINNDLEYQKTNRFSHLIANHFTSTYTNISSSGASNDWIVEKTIEWFEEGNTCDIAVIQFTDKARTIWYDEETNKEYKFGPFKIDYTKPDHPGYDSKRTYYKFFYSDHLGTQNFYKNLFFLTNYLKSKNINYIFLSINDYPIENKGWARYCKNIPLIKITNLLGSKINHQRITDLNENYCPDLYQHNQKDLRYIFFRGTHPSKIGHQKIAQHIIDTIGTPQ